MNFKQCIIGSSLLLATGLASAYDISGWECAGYCGSVASAVADEVVTNPPGATGYAFVSTASPMPPYAEYVPNLELGEEETGSRVVSQPFAAQSNDDLLFHFNYVTSDGAGYADYAWVRLLDADNGDAVVAILFTARSTSAGNTVPGFDMPSPTATLTPASTPIIGEHIGTVFIPNPNNADYAPGSIGPKWAPLDYYDGTCFATGCGYTGWIESRSRVPATGNYKLELGVVEWRTPSWASGLAFSGITIAGHSINDGGNDGTGGGDPADVKPVPLWGPLALLLATLGFGVAGAVAARRRPHLQEPEKARR